MCKLYTNSNTEISPICLDIDEKNKTVKLNGEACELTHQEYTLLHTLALHYDRTVSRGELLMTAWGYIQPGITRTVDVHIQRLRKKLGAGCIETVYRCGYKLLASPA